MKTVLIIEDDVVLRENTAELLVLSQYNVISAPNGKVGVDLAKQQLPDIIVCDIMMPELDGYGTLKALAEHNATKHIPFIFLSAKVAHKDVRKGMNMGADDYITKPFSEDEIISAIESRLAKAAILKELNLDPNASIEDDDKIKTLNDLKNFFDDNGTTFFYDKDTVIYHELDHSNYIYLINKGTVKCFRIDIKGKELTTALFKEDDLFGYDTFVNNLPHRETATAIEDVELQGLSSSQFSKILEENHKVALEFIQLLSDDLSLMKNQLLEMAYSSVNRKTAATILKFAEKINRKPGDSIKISRSDLASIAGIATETLIRALTNFKKEGIIKSDGRNIKVLDLEKLKEMS
jgi:DNA-binding response OmpR family regulator